jgi:hypothetical protein
MMEKKIKPSDLDREAQPLLPLELPESGTV